MKKKSDVDKVSYSFKDAILELMEERNMSQELAHIMVENTIKAAYKKRFMTDENCVVDIADDNSRVDVYIRKRVVADDEQYDTLMEITLSDAKKIDENAEIDDVILESVDPRTFDRASIASGKQKFKQNSREIQWNHVYNEFKAKERELITGYVQTVDSKTGDVYVDLGGGNVGILRKMYQSPIETYRKDDKIYVYIEEVKEGNKNVEIILSRSSSELVKKFLEAKIPEIANGSIEIYKVARKAGYKTKVAVYAVKDNIDPVGTCIGIKGVRIQQIISELGGEKIDIVEFNEQVEIFIANALTPATVKMVRVLDYNVRKVIAITDDKTLAVAIGRDGLNVQLANKLTDWLIDVKTEKQYEELDLDRDIKSEADKLYDDLLSSQNDAVKLQEEEYAQEDGEDDEEIQESKGEESEDDYSIITFDSLNLSERIKEKIRKKNIHTIEELANIGAVDIMEFFEFTTKENNEFLRVLGDYVELVDDEE